LNRGRRTSLPMSDMINALRRELSQLEAELRSDPRFVKVQKIKDLLAEYEPSQGKVIFSATSVNAGRTAESAANARSASKAARIKAAIMILLNTKGSVHRTDILQHLVDNGLMGSEKIPLRSLAAYLSEWRADFKSDGNGNFSLAKLRESGDRRPANELVFDTH
jgi:hypothetical protein